jgi:hypothetical protein
LTDKINSILFCLILFIWEFRTLTTGDLLLQGQDQDQDQDQKVRRQPEAACTLSLLKGKNMFIIRVLKAGAALKSIGRDRKKDAPKKTTFSPSPIAKENQRQQYLLCRLDHFFLFVLGEVGRWRQCLLIMTSGKHKHPEAGCSLKE